MDDMNDLPSSFRLERRRPLEATGGDGRFKVAPGRRATPEPGGAQSQFRNLVGRPWWRIGMGRGPRTLATLFLAALAASIELSGSANRVARMHGDAAALYVEHCSACHGKEGHGDGPTAAELKYRPRDFKAGSFAFGNTTDAMVKTILSGIPGEEQARMPPFKGVLTVEEIEAVVGLVRTMMPAEVLPTPAEMRMEPRDGPLFVRGLLAPFKTGDPPIARGLLLGLPGGITFEYATDDLRLLAVRRGEFATRSDWEGRGGRPLTPLGEVLFATAQSEASAVFFVREGEGANAKRRPLDAKLRSTSTKGGRAELACDLVDAQGAVQARVRERPREVVVSDGTGILQEFEFAAPAPMSITVSIAIPRDLALATAPPEDNAILSSLEGSFAWSLAKSSATTTIAVGIRAPERNSVNAGAPNGRLVVEASFEVGPKPTTLTRIVLACGPNTPEQLRRITNETKELR
jgi:mono/diheme cytochrome c family protein